MAARNTIIRLLAGVGGLLSAGVAYSQATGHFAPFHADENPVAARQLLTESPIHLMLVISELLSMRNGMLLGGGPLQAAVGATKGMAAGGVGPGWNAWANASYNDLGYSSSQVMGTADFDGRRRSVAVGADHRLSPALTVGVSVGFDDGEIKPDQGFGVKFTDEGFNVVPYVAYQINRNYSIDASIGWGRGELEREDDFFPSSSDTDRLFGSINLNSGHWFNNIQIAGKASLLYSTVEHDSDRDNFLEGDTNHLGQARVGVQAGYWVGNGLMPFVGATYVYDFTDDETHMTPEEFSFDRNGVLVAVGVNYLSKSPISGGISYTTEVDRSGVTNDVVMANLNLRF